MTTTALYYPFPNLLISNSSPPDHTLLSLHYALDPMSDINMAEARQQQQQHQQQPDQPSTPSPNNDTNNTNFSIISAQTALSQTATWHASSPPPSSLLVATWPADPRQNKQQQPSPTHTAAVATTPFIHISHCKLDITRFDEVPSSPFNDSNNKLERVALPRSTVQTFLSSEHLTLPLGSGASVRPHFDDDDEWVYSRCLLADFSGLGEEEAEAAPSLSLAGKLVAA
ncbi:hypothetical protein B0T17DRAFT_654661 [Bombardia bombarda]|uniref:Uncharacterized protein n=1 Tax=Bombardia bombarda TaxID=252184 RepID=A0AA40C594_9PEZI|nr:hypothetical protein B0T17DRAFT_654661 [Bombardia bombarda]